MPVQVAPGYKFAVIAVPDCRAGGAPVPLLQLPDGFAVSADLPANALDTWQESIGRFHRDELSECKLFLWSLAPSAAPDVLDAENDLLRKNALRLFMGVLIATPYFSSGRLTLLTGANADGTARARSLATYDRTYYTLGAPAPGLSTSRLRLAARLADALQSHDQRPHKDRIERSIRAFREACESSYLDQRLHQFIRCAEGFAVPPNAVAFAERLGRVCAGRSRQHLTQMYRIRSGVEHLHGPYDRMPKRASKRARRLLLLMRSVEAEALARYLLTTFLLHPALWPHFQNRRSIDAMWTMPPARFRAIWPTKLGFPAILRSFDYAEVPKRETEV